MQPVKLEHFAGVVGDACFPLLPGQIHSGEGPIRAWNVCLIASSSWTVTHHHKDCWQKWTSQFENLIRLLRLLTGAHFDGNHTISLSVALLGAIIDRQRQLVEEWSVWCSMAFVCRASPPHDSEADRALSPGLRTYGLWLALQWMGKPCVQWIPF